ncbi:hypothetical protein GCM10009416_43570 [Craurococcus roseus]|uniref:Uncharacterized protein n=1 Tax=Craurococcus roseus TaxID=77585 RepID=A0ABP3R0E2_9PROT
MASTGPDREQRSRTGTGMCARRAEGRKSPRIVAGSATKAPVGPSCQNAYCRLQPGRGFEVLGWASDARSGGVAARSGLLAQVRRRAVEEDRTLTNLIETMIKQRVGAAAPSEQNMDASGRESAGAGAGTGGAP